MAVIFRFCMPMALVQSYEGIRLCNSEVPHGHSAVGWNGAKLGQCCGRLLLWKRSLIQTTGKSLQGQLAGSC